LLYTSLGGDNDARRAAYVGLVASEAPPIVMAGIRTAARGRHTLGMTSHHQAVAAMYGDSHDSGEQSPAPKSGGAPAGAEPANVNRAPRERADRKHGG